MRRTAGWLALSWLLAGQIVSWALDPSDYAFLLSAQGFTNPPRLQISWPQKPEANSIRIRRKKIADTDWGDAYATLAGDATSYTDENISLGQSFEYEFSAVLGEEPFQQTAYGYLYAGINPPAIERRGKIILLIDSTHADALTNELARLQMDLVGDGWEVLRHDVAPDQSVTSVKALIAADYLADPRNVRAVFLFGHVPVPYSGELNPDMHDDHLGAWPADVYYGDIAGVWTDRVVDFTASRPENDNLLNDGKFDQSLIPSPVELEVGRVDLSNLPWFDQSERELLRNYLNKNHAFRHGLLRAAPRGLIRDNFGVIDEDAPAVDAWRAFPALFGPGGFLEIGPDEFFQTLQNQSYLWAYGGGGGEFYQADGVGSSLDFNRYDPQAIFYLLHGSYFGDWNTENNFLRAALAGPTAGLVSIWSSLPHWYFHHLALGETIGFATRLTQNNRDLYHNQIELSTGQVHISMMGDPTLHPFVVMPPKNLRFNNDRKPSLTWDPSPDAVDGYFVYRAKNDDGPYTRVSGLLTETSFDENLPGSGKFVYMVRAVAMQTTGSGSFQNLSQGIFVDLDVQPAAIESRIDTTALSAGGNFQLHASGYPNRPYRIESRAPDGSWQTRTTGLSSDDGSITFSEPPAAASQWYRIVWP